MAFSKVTLNGTTLMDVTQKTVTANTMLSGTTALKNDGTDITGSISSKSSTDLTASGATVTAPAGYYVSAASKSVASGTAGTPTATKGTVSDHAVSVTPSVTNTEGYISGGTKTGTAVSVSASELVSGTKSITASGTTDVTNYASASVAAGSTATPATSITANPAISVDSSGLITSSVSTSQSVTPTVSAGYVSSGTAGTVSVSGSNTEQLSTQAATTITPTTSSQTAVAAGKYTTGAVTVAAIPSNYIIPTGSFSAISNGTYNVTSYASVIVDVANTIVPEGTNVSVDGTTLIIEDGGGSSVTVSPLSVTTNGTYTAPTGTAYSPVTVNVSSGGTTPASPKDVNFIDYDGTILYSYTKSEFAQLDALPANPDHSGDEIPLTSQGWNWTLAQINAQLTAQPNDTVTVGQMYVTTDGKTYIEIELHEGRLSPYLGIAVNGTVVVDWGDNTATSTVTESSLTTQIRTLHEYAAAGRYSISISVSSGSFAFYGTSTYFLLNKNSSTANQNRVYSNAVQSVRIGNNASIGAYAFYYCNSLVSITIPSGVTSIGNRAFYGCYSLASITISSGVTSIGSSAFYYCYSLASITISSGVTSIGSDAFYYCYSLASITIPSGVTSIGSGTFYNCYSLVSITIPSGVTSIGNSAFYYCCGLAKLRFLPTTPPTVANSNAFTNIPTDCVISVPTGSLSAYTSATNYPSSSTYTYIEE